MEIDLNMLGQEILSLESCDMCAQGDCGICDCEDATLDIMKTEELANKLQKILGQIYLKEQIESKLKELFNQRLEGTDIFECEYCPKFSQREDVMCENKECYIEQAKMFLKFIGEPYSELILEEL